MSHRIADLYIVQPGPSYEVVFTRGSPLRVKLCEDVAPEPFMDRGPSRTVSPAAEKPARHPLGSGIPVS